MSEIDEIRKELQGRTGMEKTHEDDLLARILEIEGNDGVVTPLAKPDWVLVVLFIVVMGIAPVLWYASNLF